MAHLLKIQIYSAVFFLSIGGAVYASTDTIGPNGINSDGLTLVGGMSLTGAGIAIGQVERGRPGDVDVGDDLAHRNTTTNPAGVFIQDNPGVPPANSVDIRGHSQRVAGVMISTDATDPNLDGDAPTGVATGASLYSSAYVTTGTNPGYQDAILTLQHVATQNGGDVRAINHSWGKELPMGGSVVLDGNSQLTLGLDWSASQHDVLHIISGNQGAMRPVPKDNFNGMTVARSVKIGGVYRQVSSGNTYDEDAVGDRTSIDLIAPGDDVELTGLGDVQNRLNGTSYAAPHVTGTVALLQEHADERIAAAATGWDADARRHEVMKAVLMNSADKIKDDGMAVVPGGIAIPTGGLLGMERTVVMQDGSSTWFDSFAYDDASPDGFGTDIPLDLEMGTGHLNARRALQQFIPGEHDADQADVPSIGWDYGTTTGEDDINRYRFNQEFEAGNFISITLAWDRNVEFDVDGGTIGVYDIGDTFEEYPDEFPNPDADSVINDLDIFLLPRGGLANDAIAASNAIVGTLEHLFFQIPTTGEYEFWVEQFDEESFSVSQDYAVAWWYGLAPDIIVLGDFSLDGVVGIEDVPLFILALTDPVAFAAAYPNLDVDAVGDFDGNGVFDLGEIAGFSAAVIAPGQATSVPEPSAHGLLILAMAGMILIRPRRPVSFT